MRLVKSILLISIITALAFVSCEREKRQFKTTPPSSPPNTPVRQTELQPGPHVAQPQVVNPYEGNAYAMSEGKTLFEWFNCVGCHAHGGGAIGPALMDEKWIYGASPQNLYDTIAEGRPNGMPAFGDKLSSDQIWKLVAYVRSLAGQTPKDASPSRSDHMNMKPSEQEMPQQPLTEKKAEHK
ncbi:MAG TPA: c-type cytochrome [Blastocatellia bacterium]|nr:c-type cytochrome [Blastocatellia bacterium]